MPQTNSGDLYGISFEPGMSRADMYTVASFSQVATQPIGTKTDSGLSQPAQKTGALWYLLGFVILIFAAKFLVEHEKSGLDPKIMGFGLFNMLAATIMVIPGIAVTKIVLNKYQVKGLTDLVNIV